MRNSWQSLMAWHGMVIDSFLGSGWVLHDEGVFFSFGVYDFMPRTQGEMNMQA